SSKKALSFLLTRFRPAVTKAGGGPALHVTVAHVMPFLNYPELKEVGNRLVDEWSEKLTRAGFTFEGLCRLGKPADEILKIASHQRADLIVMGAKGLGAIARFLLGSVSTRVVQVAGPSVLIVR